eukprot:PhF_6_TR12628/c2_g1_i3/m.19988
MLCLNRRCLLQRRCGPLPQQTAVEQRDRKRFLSEQPQQRRRMCRVNVGRLIGYIHFFDCAYVVPLGRCCSARFPFVKSILLAFTVVGANACPMRFHSLSSFASGFLLCAFRVCVFGFCFPVLSSQLRLSLSTGFVFVCLNFFVCFVFVSPIFFPFLKKDFPFFVFSNFDFF